MTSDDLTPEQAERIRNALVYTMRYLDRLIDRMNRRQFPPRDPMLLAALKARDALQELGVEVHYAGCKSGVGKRVE